MSMRSDSSSRSDRRLRGDRHRGINNPETRSSRRRHFDRSPSDRRRSHRRHFEERAGEQYLNSRTKKFRRSPTNDAPEKSKRILQ